MTAGLYNFTCEQGVTFHRTLVLSDANGPLNLTGFSARMQVRKQIDAPEVLIELSTDNGRITLEVNTGTVLLDVSAEDTAAIHRPGFYDLTLYNPSGEVVRVIEGQFFLRKAVTR